jgi:hypothetical protein
MRTVTEQTQEKDLEFLPDRPTIEDAIGVHRVIASNLKQIVMGGLPKPFVVGLYGSWGSGKSSVVEMLRTSSDQQFKIVVVDAWRKDKDNFLRQFVKKLANELLSPASAADICKEVDFKESTQTNSWIPSKFAKIAFVIYLLVALYLLLGTIWNSLNFPNYPAKETAPLEFLILTAIAFQWLLPKYSHHVQLQTAEITIEDPAWFRKMFFKRILNDTSRISVCIVIDNLDRVAAEDALAIIKFIKTFIVDDEDEKAAQTKTQVSFLIPCDDRALINRIKDDGRDDETAAEFLRKFITRIPQELRKSWNELFSPATRQG